MITILANYIAFNRLDGSLIIVYFDRFAGGASNPAVAYSLAHTHTHTHKRARVHPIGLHLFACMYDFGKKMGTITEKMWPVS